VPPATDLVRQLWAAIDAQDPAAVEPLIHPQAKLEMAMARGKAVEGREAAMATLRSAWRQVHTLRLDSVEQLDDEVVLVLGRSRYALPNGGFADSGFAWLCEWQDGMLHRQRLFASADDARAAWQEARSRGSGRRVSGASGEGTNRS
jgi:hypothetical protein